MQAGEAGALRTATSALLCTDALLDPMKSEAFLMAPPAVSTTVETCRGGQGRRER